MGENGQSGHELTPIQERFLAAYITCHNATEAAKQAGMKENTARRLLKSEAFVRSLRATQSELFECALNGLRLDVEKAITTLVRHMDADTTPPGTQVRAAQIYLEQAIAFHKMSELEARVTEMERATKERLEAQQ